jgi:poly-gamma-glutamate synthesis protein (capsule biosynthesis protein)
MKIIVAGDYCPQGRVAPLIDSGDFNSVLGGVRALVSEADYSVVNFECPVCKGGELPLEKQGPNLCCSGKGVESIKWAGFDCVTLANNHFYDYGDAGVKNTIEKCAEVGLDTVGGGMNLKEASEILYKRIEDKTLAVINCCEHEFSIASETHGGSNPLNPIQQYYAIRQAKENADYVLVIVHGGHEHWQLPSPRMKETYRFFIDAGADVVVNHHQHCFSGFENYNGKPIFYGLGNFCFDRKGNWGQKWHEGLLLMLTFEEEVGYEIFPYQQCLEKPSVEFLERGSYDVQLVEINKILQDDKRLAQETEKYYASVKDKMCEVFEPINARYYLAGKRRGVLPSLVSKKRKLMAENLICCEAHRDKMIYFLSEE